jgi:PAS domain S-box-containing protein
LRVQVKSKTKELLIKNEELIREIQFRKQAEEALQASGATLRSIFKAAPTGIGLADDRVIRQANERLGEMLGYSQDELVGRNARLIYPTDEEFEHVGKEKYAQIREKGTGTIETQWQRKDGEVFDVLLSSAPFDPEDLSKGVTFTALDITYRKQAELALRESEEECRGLFEESKRSEKLYRSLLHSSADAIVMYDFEGKVEYISPMFTKIFGWTLEEIIGERVPFLPDFEKEATMNIIKDLVENGTPCHGFETKRYTKEGNLLDVSISASRYDDHEGKPAGTLAILRDISEKRKLEAQLRQAHKMEAIGTLAGGIAHDFNNLMMGMLGNISLILNETDPDHPHHEKLKNVEELIQSSSKLTNQLLGFARKGKYEVKPTNLNQIIKESLETFGRARKEITIHRNLAKNLFALELDETQIQQVLLNLYINAGDAMPGGGDLFLKTMNVTHKEMQGRPYDTKPGNYVMLEIPTKRCKADRTTPSPATTSC